MTDWKREAQEQAAKTGELLIKLAERLEYLRTQISATRQMWIIEDNNFDRVILKWKLDRLQDEESWLEGILFAKPAKHADESVGAYADMSTMMPGA